MKKWISRGIILSLILSFSLVSSVTAEETKIGLLKAESESEVQLDRVEIYKDENGYDRVRITDTRPANGEPEKYRITVNRETGTYKTKLQELTDVEREEIKSGMKAADISPNATSYWTAWVKGTVTDPQPINASLASLRVDLTWGINGSIVSFSSNDITPWAARPSSMQTNWYVSGSNLSQPSYRYSGNNPVKVVQDGSGEFYNYDFLDNDKITEASVWIRITGNNDKTYTYNTDTGFRGEASYLLDLDVVTN